MKNSLKKLIVATIALTSITVGLQAAIITWDDGAGNPNQDYWSKGDNWSGTPDNTSPVSGDSVVLTATAQSFMDYDFTVVSGQSITSDTSGFGDDMRYGTGGATLTLATGGLIDAGFIRTAPNQGARLVIEHGATFNVDNMNQDGTAAMTFVSDANSVTTLNVDNQFNGSGGDLFIDLTDWALASSGPIILVDYDTLNGNFNNFGIVGPYQGTLDYTFDQGGGDLAIALTGIYFAAPEPSSLALLGMGAALLAARRRRKLS